MTNFDRIPIVDVHVDNFRESWPSLILAIRSAGFIALDLELSGLGRRNMLQAKSVDDRYKGIAECARTRAILSLGISCFQPVKNETEDLVENDKNQQTAGQCYFVQTFNIMLLCSEEYVVEPASLRFLVDHGFDFNKQYSSGIPYYRGNDKGNEKDNLSVRQLLVELIMANTPIVLHNGLVDLMFLYQNLYANIPTSMSTFSADLSEMFHEGIYDTKYITDFAYRMTASYLEYVFKKCLRENTYGHLANIELQFLNYPEGSRHVTYRQCAARPQQTLPQNKDYVEQVQVLKEVVCENYAGHGWCNQGNKCQKSHDLDLILDLDHLQETKKSRKRKRRRNRQTGDTSVDDNVTMETDETLSDTETIYFENAKNVSKIAKQCEDDDSFPSSDGSQGINSSVSSSNCQSERSNVSFSGGHRAGFDAFMTGYIMATYFATYDGNGDDAGGLSEFKNKIYLSGKDYPLQVMKSGFAKNSKEHSEKIMKIRSSSVH
ncbi:hypothetical protein CHS0354_026541 [Potamilus streckersoni]|uniref:Target of EGR1 protein 1 n=1 Tax=Potamilus streckersoni TaxID=2493646 RepID=A0AAE0VH88_9BIVA|nr:hypothetical protein CHS0354_026541 [Potamilus streckersoni]